MEQRKFHSLNTNLAYIFLGGIIGCLISIFMFRIFCFSEYKIFKESALRPIFSSSRDVSLSIPFHVIILRPRTGVVEGIYSLNTKYINISMCFTLPIIQVTKISRRHLLKEGRGLLTFLLKVFFLLNS